MSDKSILITGFGPFLEHSENPSQVLAKLLSEKIKGFATVCNETISVDRQGLKDFYTNVLTLKSGFDFVVHFGLNASATKIHMETIALNCIARRSSDQGDIEPIDHEGLELLPCTFEFNLIHDWILKNKDYVAYSRDAGQYFCNELLYRSIQLSHDSKPGKHGIPQVLFIHIPDISVLSLERQFSLMVDFFVCVSQ